MGPTTARLAKVWLAALAFYVAVATAWLWIIEADLVRSSQSVAPEGRGEIDLSDAILRSFYEVDLAQRRQTSVRSGLIFFGASAGLILLRWAFEGSEKAKETRSP